MIDLINKICGELPGNFLIEICMENGAAWVEMKHLGCYVNIDTDDLSLERQLEEALKVAKEYEI